MKKRFLTLGIVLVLLAVLVTPMAVLADHQAGQGAETTLAETILIRKVDDSADCSNITFPAAAAGSTVTNPTGNADVQVLTAVGTEAQPVAILTSGVAYTLWYNVSDDVTWAETVATEYIQTIAIDGSLTLTDFTTGADEITAWDTDQLTTQSLDGTLAKELYLGVLLQSTTGQSGTSTITILGES